MALTDDNLVLKRGHPLGGIQRIYRFASGKGLSVVNSPILHSYPFQWEVAVLSNVTDEGNFDKILYDTELTSDVEVFMSNSETNEFIARAKSVLS